MLKEKIRSSQILYWTSLTIPDQTIAVLAKQAGYDFVVIDALNSVMADMSVAAEMIRICKAIGLPAIYRSNNDDDLIRALDLGADGVACMNIRNREDMQRMKDRIYFYPQGRRRPNPFTPFANYGVDEFSNSKKQSNRSVVIWVFVEESVSNPSDIKEILSVPEVDICYLGQYVNKEKKETVLNAYEMVKEAKLNNVAVAGFHYGMNNSKYDEFDRVKFEIQNPTVIGVATDNYLIFKGLKSGLDNLKMFNSSIANKIY